MMLADTFRKMGIAVIESYPGAAQDIMGIPRKRASLELLAKGLENFGVSGDFTRIQVSHDELDAITSAIVGLYFWGGRFEAIGKEEEEFLIIPDLRIDPHPWRQRSVIGLSGPIAAGKTTAAKLLESKGYHYGRFSQVLEVMLKNKGMEPNRAALQRIGEEVNKTKGQRWLGRRLLDGFVQSTTLVIDGLRFPEDHAFMKETFGPGFIHVHLTAPKSMRLQRYVVRTGNKKEFLKAANHEVENQVKKLYSLANFVVNNEGDIRELETEISRIVLDNVASGKRYS
jgi:dephospho-CoA kinase